MAKPARIGLDGNADDMTAVTLAPEYGSAVRLPLVAFPPSADCSARIANSKSAHVFQMRQRRMDRSEGAGEGERTNGTDDGRTEEARGRKRERERREGDVLCSERNEAGRRSGCCCR